MKAALVVFVFVFVFLLIFLASFEARSVEPAAAPAGVSPDQAAGGPADDGGVLTAPTEVAPSPPAAAPSSAPPGPAASATVAAGADVTPARTNEYPRGTIELIFVGSRFRLDAAGSFVDDRAPENLHGSLGQFGVSGSLGGDRFFFRSDVLGGYGEIRSIGVGVYPACYGYYFRTPRLFPFVAAGGVMQGLFLRGPDRAGYLVYPRVALGLKRIGFGPVGVSAEIGMAPHAWGRLEETTSFKTSPNRGGEGLILDFSAGLGWF